jgi:DMSO/TMAO reductase YedYZ molybdopterin-dependent catalytic subunit
MSKEPDVLAKLPVHHSNQREAGTYLLRVDGSVRQSLELTVSDLERLPQQCVTEDFTCEEGWTVPKVKWRGVMLESLLSIAGVHPNALWVQASAGEFTVPIPLQDTRGALLATHLGESALSHEHGGPVRLVVPGGDCWTSIKWLDHVELRTEPGSNTGKTIALGRLRPCK